MAHGELTELARRVELIPTRSAHARRRQEPACTHPAPDQPDDSAASAKDDHDKLLRRRSVETGKRGITKGADTATGHHHQRNP